ncbi:hypothetical protein LguiA_022967 [Lonicera macranthoides]
MMMACHKLDGLVVSVNNGGSHRPLRRRHIDRCRVFSVDKSTSSHITLNGFAAGPPSVLEGKKKESTSPISMEILGYAAEQMFGADGKRIRAALVFLVSRATREITGFKEITEEQRCLAGIVEMTHNACMMHNDVLDQREMPRGRENIRQVYGERVTELAGDFLFAHSLWYNASLENLQLFKLLVQVIKNFASGEIKEASTLFDCNVKLEEYITKIYCKTATTFAASTKGAAILSGTESDVIEHMFNYGINLGLSFQIVDDILDFTRSAAPENPVGGDLARGKITAPVIFALENESGAELREIIGSGFGEMGSVEKGIELVKKSGGIERAIGLAREKGDFAIRSLSCLPESEFRVSLEGMVKYNLDRM